MLKKILYVLCLINCLHSYPPILYFTLQDIKHKMGLLLDGDWEAFFMNDNEIRLSQDEKTREICVNIIKKENFFLRNQLFFFGFLLGNIIHHLEINLLTYINKQMRLIYFNKLKRFYINIYNKLSSEEKAEYKLLIQKKDKHLCIKYLNEHALHQKNNIVWSENQINLIWSLNEWDKDFFITISKLKATDFPVTYSEIIKCSLLNIFYTLKKKVS